MQVTITTLFLEHQGPCGVRSAALSVLQLLPVPDSYIWPTFACLRYLRKPNSSGISISSARPRPSRPRAVRPTCRKNKNTAKQQRNGLLTLLHKDSVVQQNHAETACATGQQSTSCNRHLCTRKMQETACLATACAQNNRPAPCSQPCCSAHQGTKAGPTL